MGLILNSSLPASPSRRLFTPAGEVVVEAEVAAASEAAVALDLRPKFDVTATAAMAAEGPYLHDVRYIFGFLNPLHPCHIQCSCSGWPTGNGKKLNNSQSCCLTQLFLAAA